LPLIPLALRMEAALLADCSKADGTTALDFLVLEEFVDDDVDELEELAVLEEADVAGLLAVGCTG
jgi:hypothetical protein